MIKLIPAEIRNGKDDDSYVLLLLQLVLMGVIIPLVFLPIVNEPYGVFSSMVVGGLMLGGYFYIKEIVIKVRVLIVKDRANTGNVFRRESHITVFVLGFIGIVVSIIWLIG